MGTKRGKFPKVFHQLPIAALSYWSDGTSPDSLIAPKVSDWNKDSQVALWLRQVSETKMMHVL